MSAPLADFTRRLLTRNGALVEQDQAEIVAVLPAPVASQLDGAEYQRFAFDRRIAGPHTLVVDYDSSLLERFERLVAPLGRIACAPSPSVDLKPIDPEEVVAHAFTLTNGIVRNCRAEAARAQYVGFLVQFELLADERVSGLTEVWVNRSIRSVPRLDRLSVRLLSEDQTVDGDAEVGTLVDVRELVVDAWRAGAALTQTRVKNQLQDAIASLQRRRERDFARLREYYQIIDEEIRGRARRARVRKDEAAVKAEALRLVATAEAFRGRAADLLDRYRARVRLEPLAAIARTLPVHRITTRVHRRSASRTIAVAWNPVDRAAELPPCDGCGIGVATAALCDDRVHLLCSSCLRYCESCGRSFCGVCHRQCPRPRH